jgi:uncharacterized protein (DUF433 family)
MEAEGRMQLEDYFDFTDYEKDGEIRIEGHRIYMHNFLVEYLKNGVTTLEALRERYPSLRIDEILACQLYYHTHQAEMDQMLESYLEYCQRHREEYERVNADKLADVRRRMLEYRARTQATP